MNVSFCCSVLRCVDVGEHSKTPILTHWLECCTQILMTKPTVTAVLSKSDFMFKNSSNYKDSHVLCLPSKSAWNYFENYITPHAEESIKVKYSATIHTCRMVAANLQNVAFF